MGLGAAYLTKIDNYTSADSLSKVAASCVQADDDTVVSLSAGSTVSSTNYIPFCIVLI